MYAILPLGKSTALNVASSDSQFQMQGIQDLGRRYVNAMQLRLPAARSTATHVVDKMLRNVWNVGYIAIMLPNACIIQVVRHPLDTALSCYAQPFEGRGTPWAWDLQGMIQNLHLALEECDTMS